MKKVTIDCMYEACPIPLLKTIKKMKDLEIGDMIVIETDHTCALINIEDWVKKEGHICSATEVSTGEWEIYVEKRK